MQYQTKSLINDIRTSNSIQIFDIAFGDIDDIDVFKGLIADNNKSKKQACMFSILTDDEIRVGALAFLRNTQTLSFHRILLGLEDQRHHWTWEK